MSQTAAIALQNISKIYKRYHHPVERLKETLFPGTAKSEAFWALRDISLEIAPGDTVGIIGRNGSGKSTLLQIIAGTLQASSGQTNVQGRVSALLELGSGFNPEFTGRQNAFFNGRVLGLSQAEIAAKFDDIVRFADIGDFIEQPVRTYSSGMFVRLAFAVAINVDPDILIVDEALSVGDEAFQRKCFARIHDLQKRGVTVLLVSHSATSIVELCDHAVLMDEGEIIAAGVPKTVVANYQKMMYAPEAARAQIRADLRAERFDSQEPRPSASPSLSVAPPPLTQSTKSKSDHLVAYHDPALVPQHVIHYQSQGAKIKHLDIQTLSGKSVNMLCRAEKYLYTYDVYFSQDATQVAFGMLIKTISGVELGGMSTHAASQRIEHIAAGSLVQVKFNFSCLLLPGTYFLNAGVLGRINQEEVFLDRAIDAAMFKVQPEAGLRATGVVDFCIEAGINQLSTLGQEYSILEAGER